MTRLHVASMLVVPLVLAHPSPAQVVQDERPAETLTLPQAIDRGLATSHRLGELEARESGAAAAIEGARASGRPQVSAQAGYTRTNHVDTFAIDVPGQQPRVVYPDIPDNLRARLDLQWPVFTFGRTGAFERAARAEDQASGLDLAAARNDLRLEITRAYWAVVTANESVDVLAESLTRMDATLGDVRNRLAAGLVPPNDVLSVEAQRARQQVLLIQARNLGSDAMAELRRLIGVSPEARISLGTALDTPAAPAPPLTDLVDEARASRPDRRALEARVDAAVERRQAAVAGGRPIVSLGGGVDYARPNPRFFPRDEEWKASWDAGVSLSWTFWSFGRVSADVAQQAAAERSARERLAEYDSRLEVEVLQRRLDLDATRAAIAAADDGVRAAADARRVVGDRFAAGVATTTDILEAQVALLQAKLDLTQSLANQRLAEARLARAVGR